MFAANLEGGQKRCHFIVRVLNLWYVPHLRNKDNKFGLDEDDQK